MKFHRKDERKNKMQKDAISNFNFMPFRVVSFRMASIHLFMAVILSVRPTSVCLFERCYLVFSPVRLALFRLFAWLLFIFSPPILSRSVIYMYYWPFQGVTFVVVPQCYMLLCPYVYGLKQYGHLNDSCPFSSLFSFCFVIIQIENR